MRKFQSGWHLRATYLMENRLKNLGSTGVIIILWFHRTDSKTTVSFSKPCVERLTDGSARSVLSFPSPKHLFAPFATTRVLAAIRGQRSCVYKYMYARKHNMAHLHHSPSSTLRWLSKSLCILGRCAMRDTYCISNTYCLHLVDKPFRTQGMYKYNHFRPS